MASLLSCKTKVFISFWACVTTNSFPLVSSMENSLYPPPPLVLLDLIPLMFCKPGRRPRGHLFGVVHPARDDGAVGIAFEKIDNDFLADARGPNPAPLFAGPRLRGADPARALIVVLAHPVPVELDFDPAVFVGVNLLARWTDHHRGLRPLHQVLGGDSRRPERHRQRRASEAVRVGRSFARIAAVEIAGMRAVRHLRQHVLSILILPLVLGQFKSKSAGEGPAVAVATNHLMRQLLFLNPQLRLSVALALLLVLAGIIEDFVLLVASLIDACC